MTAELDPSGALAVYAVGVPLVLCVIAVEAVVNAWQKRGFYVAGDTWCSLGLLAGNILVNAALKTLTLDFYLYLYQFRLWDLSSIFPLWLVWVLSFVLIDLVFYWYHRMSHRVRFLWAIHMCHHSSEEMNFVVAFRQAWLGPVSKIPFFAVLPLIGLDPTITLVAGVAATLWGVWGHTRIIDTLLLPIEWLFNTPSHHRVHHGSNPEYIDKNYGNLFILWDRLFGTFAPERNAVIYGIQKNVGTYNPLTITLLEWRNIIRDIRAAPDFRHGFYALFGPPEWQPNQDVQSDAALQPD